MPLSHAFRAAPMEQEEIAPQSDEDLVVAAQKDPKAFTPLYERYLEPIYRYCYLHLGHRESAEDATSEVFLKALANLHRYRSGLFVAWLFRIAKNVVTDVHRKRRATDALENFALAAPGLSPEESAEAQAEWEALLAALRTLPDEQRTVIELQLAGLGSAQIAATLGKSLAAVKMIRYRAVAQLRKLLVQH